jgi:hypothetical protein
MATAAERDELRSSTVAPFNKARQDREAQYISDKRILENEYLADLKANRQDRENALIDAGLNPDGSDPQGRPQGSQI